MSSSDKSKGKLKVPVVDTEICKNCKKCINACPNNAIKTVRKDTCSRCLRYCFIMKVPCKPEKVIFEYKNCDSCGLCVDICPENAIYWFKLRQGEN
jgi:Pyruvate/2-oxoacid:ferredoxin oxidoreductase delta subunit